MQHGERRIEARGEARDELRRQRDLGHQHQRLLAARHDRFDRAQVDLGLAAAGDAVQQERCERCRAPRRSRQWRCVARVSGSWPAVLAAPATAERGRQSILSQPCHPAALLEFPHVVAPAGRDRRGRPPRRGRAAQECDQVAQAAGPRGQRRQRAGARRGAQGPAFLGFVGAGPAAQRGGQCGGDHFAGRVTVVVRRPAQQLQQRGVEDGLLVDQPVGRLELRRRASPNDRGSLDQHADDAATTERYPEADARAQFIRGDVRGCAVVEQSPQRRVDGDGENVTHGDRRLCEVIHRACGKVCGCRACIAPKCRFRRRLLVSGQKIAWLQLSNDNQRLVHRRRNLRGLGPDPCGLAAVARGQAPAGSANLHHQFASTDWSDNAFWSGWTIGGQPGVRESTPMAGFASLEAERQSRAGASGPTLG